MTQTVLDISLLGLSSVENKSSATIRSELTSANVTTALTFTPATVGSVTAITKTSLGLGSVDNTADTAKPVSTTQATAIALKQDSSAKDASGGYVGLTTFKLNLRNVANTFTSWFTNVNTAARTYTLPDKDGTVAMVTDITGTNSGTNTGDETLATIKTKLGVTTLSGSNTGDQTTITGNAATATLLSAGADRAKLDAITGTNTGDQTKTSLGLGSVDNTADIAKVVSTPQATAIALKLDKAGGVLTGPITLGGTLDGVGNDYCNVNPKVQITTGTSTVSVAFAPVIVLLSPTAATTITFSDLPAPGHTAYWELEIVSPGANPISFGNFIMWDGGTIPSVQSGTKTTVLAFRARNNSGTIKIMGAVSFGDIA